jgi:hypothetical protein
VCVCVCVCVCVDIPGGPGGDGGGGDGGGPGGELPPSPMAVSTPWSQERAVLHTLTEGPGTRNVQCKRLLR